MVGGIWEKTEAMNMDATHKNPLIGRLVRLDPARVKPFADQPRKRFRGIAQLANSIREIGQVTPIIVTASADPDYDAELVDGERRLRACLIGKMKVKAIFEPAGAVDRFARSVAGNFCRQGHDAVEIMEAVLAMKAGGKTALEIAAIVGKTQSWVAQYSMLAKLAPEVLERLKAPPEGTAKKQLRKCGKMTLALALAIVPLPHKLQIKASRTILAKRMSLVEARTYVARLACARGVRLGKRQSPYMQFCAVFSAVEHCGHIVERYLRMPGIEITALVRNAGFEEKKRLSALLESLCESLLLLGDALAPQRAAG